MEIKERPRIDLELLAQPNRIEGNERKTSQNLYYTGQRTKKTRWEERGGKRREDTQYRNREEQTGIRKTCQGSKPQRRIKNRRDIMASKF